MQNLLINSKRVSTNRVEILFGTTWMSMQTNIRLIQEFEERYIINGKVQRRFVDFAHPETRTAIELDGSIHKRPDVQANDQRRQWEMEQLGWTFIRYTNSQIMNNPYGCAQFALQCIQSRQAMWQHYVPLSQPVPPPSFPRPSARRHHRRRHGRRNLQRLFSVAVVITAVLFLVLLTLK